mmetsp:Transcript_37483/g.74356  ORF Transcript_37483/g.74356 Transcript_37483/m.74356 type:complete len:217 (+) Transcript_37483:500-1150(+)
MCPWAHGEGFREQLSHLYAVWLWYCGVAVHCGECWGRRLPGDTGRRLPYQRVAHPCGLDCGVTTLLVAFVATACVALADGEYRPHIRHILGVLFRLTADWDEWCGERLGGLQLVTASHLLRLCRFCIRGHRHDLAHHAFDAATRTLSSGPATSCGLLHNIGGSVWLCGLSGLWSWCSGYHLCLFASLQDALFLAALLLLGNLLQLPNVPIPGFSDS